MTTASPTALPPFERVAILGVGLLGASLGLALKARGLAKKVVGIGRNGSSSLAIAQSRGAIDEPFTDPAAGVAEADLVVICTPVRQIPAMLAQIAPALTPGCLLTDVGSTKTQICDWARQLLPAHVTFVGSHPMAGSEKSGPAHATADLYNNALCLITPLPETPAAAVARIESLWKSVGMRTLKLHADTHDRWVAGVSHLPHAAAAALLNTAGRHPEALQAAAGGFLDTTRIASGDLDMWTDIFLTNPGPIVAALDEFLRDLTGLRAAVEEGNEHLIRQHLSQAKEMRDRLLKERNR